MYIKIITSPWLVAFLSLRVLTVKFLLPLITQNPFSLNYRDETSL